MVVYLPTAFFIGREAEIAQYQEFLQQEQQWILLLTGMPGIGKSSLQEHLCDLQLFNTITLYLNFADQSLQFDRLRLLEDISAGIGPSYDAQTAEHFQQVIQKERKQLIQRSSERLNNLKEALQQTMPLTINQLQAKVATEAAEKEDEDQALERVSQALWAQLRTIATDNRRLVVMFDTCEWLEMPGRETVFTWLKETFLQQLHDYTGCHVILASRSPSKLAIDLQQYTSEMRLAMLEEEAVDQFLQAHAIPQKARHDIMQLTHRHPLCFRIIYYLLQEELSEGKISLQELDRTGTLLPLHSSDETASEEIGLEGLRNKYSAQMLVELVQERLDRRLPSPLREWTHYGVLLRNFNLPVLKAVFPEMVEHYDTAAFFQTFTSAPHVLETDHNGTFTLHELLREVLVKNIRDQEPEKWNLYHQRASNYYKSRPEPENYLHFYHDIALNEEKGLDSWESALKKQLQSASRDHVFSLLNAAHDKALNLSESDLALYESIHSEYDNQLRQKNILENLETSKTIHKNSGNTDKAQKIEQLQLQIERRLQKKPKVFTRTLAFILIPLILLSIAAGGISGGLIGYQLPSSSSSLQVTTTNDSGPGSLRSAIEKAGPGATITFSALNNPIILKSDLVINKNITISGQASGNVSISNGMSGAVPQSVNRPEAITWQEGAHIKMNPNVTVVLDHLTFKDSRVFKDSFLVNNGGNVTLRNCHVEHDISYDSGGGIANVNGVLTITNSFIQSNFASSNGGGIYTRGGTLIVRQSSIAQNTAYENGGGIYGVGSTITLDSKVQTTANQALHQNLSRGAGIAVFNSSLTVNNSMITNNWTDGIGGGIAISGSQAIFTSLVVDQNSALRGRELAVETDSENAKESSVILNDLAIPDTHGGFSPKGTPYHIGHQGDAFNTIIEGKLYDTGNSRILSVGSSLTGTPAPVLSIPEQVKGSYLGQLDLSNYCNQLSGQLDALDPLHPDCQMKNQKISIDTLKLCQDTYKGVSDVTARLADYYDITSWQCYGHAQLLGTLAKGGSAATNINQYCQSINYASVANNQRTTAHDWKCVAWTSTVKHQYPLTIGQAFLAGLSVTDACNMIYKDQLKGAPVMDRIVDFNSSEGWQCWQLKP